VCSIAFASSFETTPPPPIACQHKPHSPPTHLTKAGHLDASNNYAECCMRPVAVGRKAFLFVGSERAGHAAAIYYSLVESRKANKVNPLTYRTYVLTHARNKSITLPSPDEFTASIISHIG